MGPNGGGVIGEAWYLFPSSFPKSQNVPAGGAFLNL